MGKVYDIIDAGIREWMSQQRIFFVATSPMAKDGLINCSPKGLDSLRVLDERTLAYLDYTGSGVETIAHLNENGRIVIMMCAFTGPPKIFRFHGQGVVLEKGSKGYQRDIVHFEERAGARSIIRIAVDRISDSCGFTVPQYEYQSDRETLFNWAEKKGAEGVQQYQREKNARSLDGLAGLEF